MFGTLPKTLHYWYRNYISDYQKDIEEKRWCSEKIEVADKDTDEITEKPIYVCRPENIGENMSIDDKAIGHDRFTIFSNNETGKIALIVETCKAEYVEQAMKNLGSALRKIKNVSMDMSIGIQ
jgi:transposase